MLAIAPLGQCMGENRKKALSTISRTSWERGRVNLIFSNNLAGGMSYVMKHFPSLCVLCNPCYSKWCYGQISAIAPLGQCMGENRKKALSTISRTSWERGRVNLIFSNNLAGGMSYVMKHFPSLCVLCNPCYSKWCYDQILAIRSTTGSMYGRE